MASLVAGFLYAEPTVLVFLELRCLGGSVSFLAFPGVLLVVFLLLVGFLSCWLSSVSGVVWQ